MINVQIIYAWLHHNSLYRYAILYTLWKCVICVGKAFPKQNVNAISRSKERRGVLGAIHTRDDVQTYLYKLWR